MMLIGPSQILAFGSVLALGMPLLSQAQRSAATPTTTSATTPGDPTPVAPFADPDTTRNIPGHVIFTRYTTPGQCLGAVLTAQQEIVRNPKQDTLFGPASIPDQLPASVLDIGERCRAQVSANPVAPRDMQNVFTLATLVYDTAAGDAARERWFATPQTLEDRGETLAETQAKRIDSAILNYTDYFLAGALRKPYSTRAHGLFARLDAMGQPVRNQRLAMQENILLTESGWTVQQTGRIRDPRQDLHDWLAFLAGIDSVGGIEGPAKYGAEGINPPSYLLLARFLLDRTSVLDFADSVVKAMPKLGVINALLLSAAQGWNDGVGTNVPLLHGSFWYNAAGDTLWPVPGRFSLLVHNELDMRGAAFVRRLATRYGPHGLRMLVVVKTKGYWDRSGTETGPRTAAQEAAQDSTYYLDYLKLPVMLTVEEAHFAQRPNGWWVQDQPVQYERDWEQHGTLLPTHMVMVDSTGKLFARLPLAEAYAYAYLDLMMGLDTHDTTHRAAPGTVQSGPLPNPTK